MQAQDFQTRDDIQDALVSRANSDSAFRAQLLENPRDAVREAIGIEIPGSIELKVHEEDTTNFHLVLPISDRVTENELAEIMGGSSVDDIATY